MQVFSLLTDNTDIVKDSSDPCCPFFRVACVNEDMAVIQAPNKIKDACLLLYVYT